MKEGKCAFKIITAKPTGNWDLVRPGHRWEDNITIFIEKIGFSMRDSIDSALDRDCECGIEHPGSVSLAVR